jgi:hypothetical protein
VIADKIVTKIVKVVIKLIAKQFKLDKVLEYVEKPNELDESVKRLFDINQNLADRIKRLEDSSGGSKKWYDK